MTEIWIYSLISVLIVSFISFIGIFTLSLKVKKLETILIYLISFSAGALFGDAFIHLLPEAVKFNTSLYILAGILLFFILEKIICWRHHHLPVKEIHSFAYMNLFGDALHNFMDGLIIAASYIISIPIGLATTLAIIFHEIPQEIGDFGVLVYGGFSKRRALLLNFATALTAIIGVVVALWLNGIINGLEKVIIPIAIGGFIYIAGSDLIPELHKEKEMKRSVLQIVYFIIGVLVMYSLLFL